MWPRARLSEGEVRGYRTAFPWGPLEVVAKTGRENPSLCLSFFPSDLISWVPHSPYSRRQGGTWEPGQVRDEGRCCALRFHKAVRIPKAESRDGNSPSCCWPLKTTGPALSGPRPQLLAPPVPSRPSEPGEEARAGLHPRQSPARPLSVKAALPPAPPCWLLQVLRAASSHPRGHPKPPLRERAKGMAYGGCLLGCWGAGKGRGEDGRS